MMSAHDVVAEYRAAAAARDWEHADGTQAGPCFFDLTGDGKIAEITDFWPTRRSCRRAGPASSSATNRDRPPDRVR